MLYIQSCPARPSFVVTALEKTDAWPPVILRYGFGIDDNLIGEWVRVGGGNWRDVVFVAVHNGNDFMCSLF